MNRGFFSLSAAAVFLMLSALIYYHTPPEKEAHCNPDSFGYERIALNYAHGDALKDPTTDEMPPQPLGYPFLLAGIFKLFGNDYRPVIALQLLLSLATIFLAGAAASHLFGNMAFYPAILLGVINTGFLVYPHFILTETVLTFLLALFLERFCFFVSFRSYEALLAASFLIGASLAIKAIALFFIPVFILASAYYLWSFGMQRIRILPVIGAALPIPLLIMSYNYHLYGSWQIAPTMHENIHYYFLAKVISADKNCSLSQAYEQLQKKCDDWPRHDARRWHAASEFFNSYCVKNPLLVGRLWVKEMLKTCGGLYQSQLKNLLLVASRDLDLSFFSCTQLSFFQQLNQYISRGSSSNHLAAFGWLELLITLIRYTFMVLGLGLLLSTQRYNFFIFSVAYMGYFVFVAGHDGCARYRMPIEPLIIILAAYGILLVVQKIRLRSSQSKNSQKWVPA